MPTSSHNHDGQGQGNDSDEARERKRLQNRIAQRKFRERKAQQQLLMDVISNKTGSSQNNALTKTVLKDIPVEVILWLGKICPQSGLPVPPSVSTHRPMTQTEDGSSPGDDIKEVTEETTDPDQQCKKCGRQFFSSLDRTCSCSIPTTQAQILDDSHVQHSGHFGDQGFHMPQNASMMLSDQQGSDDLSFSNNVFQVPDSMHMVHDLLPSPTSVSEGGESMSTRVPSLSSNTPNCLPRQQMSPTPQVANATASVFPDVNSNDNMSTMIAHVLPGAQETDKPLLHVAARSGHANIIRMLADHNFDVDEPDERGRTALHIAVQSQNEPIVRLLVQHGANAYLKDQDGQSPLHLAVQIGFESAVGLFLAQGAVQQQNQQLHLQQQHPLHQSHHQTITTLI